MAARWLRYRTQIERPRIPMPTQPTACIVENKTGLGQPELNYPCTDSELYNK